MPKQIFNRKKIDFTKQPMFFGEDLGVQRYDVYKYPFFDQSTQRQLGFFWRPEEVSLLKDRNDYKLLRPEQQHIFISNLKYQTMLDSVQGRGPCLAFLPFCSLPELESCIVSWDFMETIHSKAYTYVLKNLFSDPSVVFDAITGDEKIDARAKDVTETYDDLINYGYKWLLNPNSVDMKKLKEKLWLALVTVNILEGLRFYVSFACSFAFGELKLMEGSAKIISLIARDESQHLTVTQRIINLYRNQEKDKEMLQVIRENEKTIENMYKEAIESEKKWATYLFSKGSMIGLSEKLLHNYVDYIAAKRMKAIGIPVKNEIRQNPLPWTQHWLNSKGLQNAPQETEIESYVVGGVKQDVKKDTFVDFEL